MKNNVKKATQRVAARANNASSSYVSIFENNEESASLPSVGTLTSKNTKAKNFTLLVDKVPYLLKVAPFSFNDETRFIVSVNGSEDYIFIWDPELLRLRAIDDAGNLPDTLEVAINQQILAWMRENS